MQNQRDIEHALSQRPENFALLRSLSRPLSELSDTTNPDISQPDDPLNSFFPDQENPQETSIEYSFLFIVLVALMVTSNLISLIYSAYITTIWQPDLIFFDDTDVSLEAPLELSQEFTPLELLGMFKSQVFPGRDDAIFLKTEYGLVTRLENKVIWILALSDLLLFVVFFCLQLESLRKKLKHLKTSRKQIIVETFMHLASFSSFDLIRLWSPRYFIRHLTAFKHSFVHLESGKTKRFRCLYIPLQVVTIVLAFTSPLCFIFRLKRVAFTMQNPGGNILNLFTVAATIINIGALTNV